MTIKKLLIVASFAAAFSGCATTGHFTVPVGAQLELDGRPVTVGPDGKVETSPFFWNASGGVPYKMTVNGKVYEGKVKSQFRVVSIFWPPAAIIYWPMGMRTNDSSYDLVARMKANSSSVDSVADATPVTATTTKAKKSHKKKKKAAPDAAAPTPAPTQGN